MSPLLSILISVSAWLILVLLFATEDRFGKKIFLPTVRKYVDSAFAWCVNILHMMFTKFIFGSVKGVLRYGVHTTLRSCIELLRSAESYLLKLLRRNKAAMKSQTTDRKPTHLDEIAAHKESSALSLEEYNNRQQY